MGVRHEALSFYRFLRKLPSFLGQRVSLEDALSIVGRRMERRAQNLEEMLAAAVYANPRSPYRRLLELAGLTQADLTDSLDSVGVERTLERLRDEGVGLTFEEFRGEEPIERRGTVIETEPSDFDNPGLSQFFSVSTGGSTGVGRRVHLDLDHLTAQLPGLALSDHAHGGIDNPTVFWFEIPPGNGLNSTLSRVPLGNSPEHWYTPVWSGTDGYGFRFRAASRAAVAVARGAGFDVPRPEWVPLKDAAVLARWAAERLATDGRCRIRAHVSKALRVALAAKKEGIDLTGCTFACGGEPPTSAKVSQIRESGADFYSNYYFTEAGSVGQSCADSTDPNDQHLMMHHLAMIQRERYLDALGGSVQTFQFTTLLPSAPKILLNVELDDFGTVEQRPCGCPYGALGLDVHMTDVRSHRKLTGEGVTLVGSDMERILEEELPSRLGGSALDYQLVEEEDARGFTRLTLVVSPDVPEHRDQAILSALMDALNRMDTGAAMSRPLWSQAETFRVRRERPRLTPRGKHIPLVLGSRSATRKSEPGV